MIFLDHLGQSDAELFLGVIHTCEMELNGKSEITLN